MCGLSPKGIGSGGIVTGGVAPQARATSYTLQRVMSLFSITALSLGAQLCSAVAAIWRTLQDKDENSYVIEIARPISSDDPH